MIKNKLEKVCYLGDGNLDGAASYLAGVMKHYKIDFDYIPSSESPNSDFLSKNYALYIVSDYSSGRFSNTEMDHIAESVKVHGSGLFMIGGWESFHGKNGEYHKSPLAEVLPVEMEKEDDRRNSSLPIILIRREPHPILWELPWNWPACIAGYNKVKAKKDATVLLEGITIDVRVLGEEVEDCLKIYNRQYEGKNIEEQATVSLSTGDAIGFRPVKRDPILVIGSYGKGRTAAYASDLAPHWSSGLIDWGQPRITEEIGNDSIEVGLWYSKFCRNLVQWCAQFPMDAKE
ncbi:MAG: glutamine amidotransferase [Planctomycetia bacterium]|nr:glutamine amidotransferase [Planctomycetia bacterium]